jgi:hypothetical protein
MTPFDYVRWSRDLARAHRAWWREWRERNNNATTPEKKENDGMINVGDIIELMDPGDSLVVRKDRDAYSVSCRLSNKSGEAAMQTVIVDVLKSPQYTRISFRSALRSLVQAVKENKAG